uniref:Uncharacterized protein n=1 Tax=Oryza meridionalis TaxID=40149 RepID=A0A0E0ED16_9ORYZ
MPLWLEFANVDEELKREARRWVGRRTGDEHALSLVLPRHPHRPAEPTLSPPPQPVPHRRHPSRRRCRLRTSHE